MTAELIILRGPSASGKSTLALQYVEQGYVRVNKDSIRTMLHNDVWNKTNEIATVAVHNEAILQACELGRKVVVDNTHLLSKDRRFYEIFAEDMKFVTANQGFEVIFIDFFDVPIETCWERDSKRTGIARVGQEVLQKQFKQMRELIDAEAKK